MRMSVPLEQLARNQVLFRAVNEKLEQLGAKMIGGELIPFFCECADHRCLGRIEITISRYADIHEDRHQYVVLPGHLRVEGQETVEDSDYYEVVRKG
jgi:hypothetical protein